MDSTLPDQQYQQRPIGSNDPSNSTKKGSGLLKAGLFEIIFVGVVLVLLFGILNYFNILSISSLWPNQFGFLPQRLNQKLQPISTIGKAPHIPFKISCPSVKAFCEKGQGIVKDQYVGLGYILPSGTPIFAAFNGNLSTAPSPTSAGNSNTTKKILITVYLDNPDLKLRAIYFFKGSITKTGKVNKGEQIAISNGKTIKIYGNNSFVFSLIPGYLGSNTPTILNKEDFKY